MTKAFVVLSGAVLFAIPGCFVSTNDPTPVAASNSSGSLTVDWTINNSTDPNQCNQSVAADIDLIVTTPNGATVDEVTQPCVDGVTTVALSPGVYGGNAALTDAAGTERTTWLSIDPFTIHSGSDLSISVDFPANSFK